MYSLHADDPVQVGQYRLLKRLGSGGQGTVYLAEDAVGKQVALKLLPRVSEESRAQFLKEVDAARKVPQSCTARVLDVDTFADHPYIVIDYVVGPTLGFKIKEDGPFDPDALERLAIATLTALVAIHGAGVVHRDFKPDNVICGPDGPRVIDFGIARALDNTTTQRRGPIGSPRYMSPEQVSSQGTGPPSDLFSWAVTMVYAATGEHAFGRGPAPLVFDRILYSSPDLGSLDEPLRALVDRCLDKEPANRPTALEVWQALVNGTPLTPLLADSGTTVDTKVDDSIPPSDAIGEKRRLTGRSLRPWAGLLAGAALVLSLTATVDRVSAWFAGCPPPTELRVMTPPESQDAIRKSARDFSAASARGKHCRPVHITVFPQASLERLRTALLGGWAEELSTVPQPDVLLTTTSAEALYVDPARASAPPVSGRPSAPPQVSNVGPTGAGSTLIVAATPEAWKQLDQEKAAGRWRDWEGLLRAAERKRITVLRPNPDITAAGTLGSVGFYGNHPDATEADRSELKSFERQVSRVPVADVEAALCEASGRTAAVAIVAEHAMNDFNVRLAAGRSCDGQSRQQQLRSLYPADLYQLDYPFVRISWPGAQKQDKDQLMEQFRKWLVAHPPKDNNSPAGSRALDISALTATQQRLKDARGRRTVEFLFDLSGSMERSVQGGTPLRIGQDLVRDTIRELREGDRIGLSVFPDAQRGREPKQLIAAGTADSAQFERVSEQLDGLRADGEITPLYNSIRARAAELNSITPQGTLVVFTDGIEDDAGHNPKDQMLLLTNALNAKGSPHVIVVAVAGSRCSADLQRLDHDLPKLECIDNSEFSSDETLRAALFAGIWRD